MESMAATVDAAEFADWTRPALLAMTRLARRLAPDPPPADSGQESLARAWVKRGQFDPSRGTPTTWLLAIVADQSRASRRARVRRLRVVDDRADLPAAAAPEAPFALDLERAVDRLAERQQLAVHLHYFVGLSVEETASVMACSTGTVKSTLYDARAKLRTLLGENDD